MPAEQRPGEQSPGEKFPDLADDDVLSEQLGHLLEATDPVPDDLVAFASASLTWRTFGTELAELLFDSAHDATVAVRAAPAPGARDRRMLSFGRGDHGVELEVDGTRLEGVVRPEGRYRVEVQTPGGTTSTVSDAGGMFAVDAEGEGPLRLAVFPGDGAGPTAAGAAGAAEPQPLLVTAWFDRS
jgi:hypothetical protein